MEDGNLVNTETNAVITVNTIVMHNSLIGTTPYSFEKIWDEHGLKHGSRQKITVKLFRKLSMNTIYPLTPCLTVEISGAANAATWSFTFYGSERYNDSGMSYDYMARDEPVEGYGTRYVNCGRTIIKSLSKQATPTPMLPNVTPTPTPTSTILRGLRKIGDEWVYIGDNGVPLGLTPQAGDDINWLLWGLAIALPLILAALLAVEIQRRKKRVSVNAHRNDG